jgi:UPF0755 protein
MRNKPQQNNESAAVFLWLYGLEKCFIFAALILKNMSAHKTRNIIIVLLLILLIALLSLLGWREYQRQYASNVVVTDEQKHFVYIDRDDSADSVMYKIEQEAVVQDMQSFRKMAQQSGYAQSVRTGRYLLEDGMSNTRLLRVLQRGYQTPLRVTFNNIRTSEMLAGRLAKQLMVDSLEILSSLRDDSTMADFGLDAATALSLFLPDTYELYWNIEVNELLQYMSKHHQRFWTEERLEKAKNIGLTPVQVSILASIVEEETNYSPEKATVAGLYINRLHRGMLLQADPTIKFALQDFALRRVLDRHKETDSPYNTYLYTGLPPGVIRMPSAGGIDAVLNYERHNYIYMCAKEDFSGAHNFAVSLSEHNRNAARYQAALNRLKIYR